MIKALRWMSLQAILLAIFSSLSAAAWARENTDPLSALQDWIKKPIDSRDDLSGLPFAKIPLSKTQAERASHDLWQDRVQTLRASRQAEWKNESITIGENTLRFKQRRFGTRPAEGWNLYISLHGGGNAPAAVNDQQWENQIKLYQPKDSLYIAPRAPTNTWNLWHESHIDALLDRLIEDAIVLGDVNPNRVYLMGYSAGGDGVYQLAPRMADRWAAAAMMAGHPNDASPLGLRNIGFAIHVGALDNGYHRNEVAVHWKDLLDQLQANDPGGYAHEVELHAGRGHWMNLEDKSAVDWMARFTRNPTPDTVVWKQSSTPHARFYWLAMQPADARPDQLIVAHQSHQTLDLEKVDNVKSLTFMLSDRLINLDEPILITRKGQALFQGLIPRTIAAIQASLMERADPGMISTATVTVPIR